MISFPNLAVFMAATIMLNLTPGADMIYVATRSTSLGTEAGIASALGVMVGCFVHTIAAIAGLSAVMARSATAFAVIKYVGATYLIYLGVKGLLSRKKSALLLDSPQGPESETLRGLKIGSEVPFRRFRSVFWQGVITNVFNPKVALFFLAFLPQFVDAGSPYFAWQILFLAILFNTSGTIVNIGVAVIFGQFRNKLNTNSKIWAIQEKITSVILIALGIRIALLSRK